MVDPSHEKQVSLRIQAPYRSCGNPQAPTLWVVLHGYGQLARYFIRKFDRLSPEAHFVIAPQGLSRFYLPGHQKVGASWMTKEHRLLEIDHYLAYLDAVLEAEVSAEALAQKRLVLLGFSQGCATLGRWLAHRKLRFDHLVFWAGNFPHELQASDFDWYDGSGHIWAVAGEQDPYLDEARIQAQRSVVEAAMGQRPQLLAFEGKHELRRDTLERLVERFQLPRPESGAEFG